MSGLIRSIRDYFSTEEEIAERRNLLANLELVKLASTVAAVGFAILAATSLIAQKSLLCFLYVVTAYLAFEIRMVASNLVNIIRDPVTETAVHLLPPPYLAGLLTEGAPIARSVARLTIQ